MRKVLRWFSISKNWPMKKGTKIGQYEIQQFLGSGGYALAYQAYDTQRLQHVLLKQLRFEVRLLEPECIYEADLLSELEIDGVPKLYEVLSWKKKMFLVLDYFEGDTVADLLIRNEIVIDETKALRIMDKLLKTVVAFHEEKIVHLDLRIPNILFFNEEVRIIDWGLSERMHEDEDARQKQIQHELYHIGHFCVFMLYSNFEKHKLFQKERPWYEELPVSQPTIDWLFRMMGEKEPFESSAHSLVELKRILNKMTEENHGII
ncbi:MAG: protein kinase domain-containing protein [Bacilli bacterium]